MEKRKNCWKSKTSRYKLPGDRFGVFCPFRVSVIVNSNAVIKNSLKNHLRLYDKKIAGKNGSAIKAASAISWKRWYCWIFLVDKHRNFISWRWTHASRVEHCVAMINHGVSRTNRIAAGGKGISGKIIFHRCMQLNAHQCRRSVQWLSTLSLGRNHYTFSAEFVPYRDLAKVDSMFGAVCCSSILKKQYDHRNLFPLSTNVEGQLNYRPCAWVDMLLKE